MKIEISPERLESACRFLEAGVYTRQPYNDGSGSEPGVCRAFFPSRANIVAEALRLGWLPPSEEKEEVSK